MTLCSFSGLLQLNLILFILLCCIIYYISFIPQNKNKKYQFSIFNASTIILLKIKVNQLLDIFIRVFFDMFNRFLLSGTCYIQKLLKYFRGFHFFHSQCRLARTFIFTVKIIDFIFFDCYCLGWIINFNERMVMVIMLFTVDANVIMTFYAFISYALYVSSCFAFITFYTLVTNCKIYSIVFSFLLKLFQLLFHFFSNYCLYLRQTILQSFHQLLSFLLNNLRNRSFVFHRKNYQFFLILLIEVQKRFISFLQIKLLFARNSKEGLKILGRTDCNVVTIRVNIIQMIITIRFKPICSIQLIQQMVEVCTFQIDQYSLFLVDNFDDIF